MIPLGILASAAVIAAPPPTGVMLASDSFNRANTGSIAGSMSDSAHGGTAYAWHNNASHSISGNQIAPTSTLSRYSSLPIPHVDVRVSIRVVAFGGGYIEIVARASESDLRESRIAARIQSDGSVQLRASGGAGQDAPLTTSAAGVVTAGAEVELAVEGETVSALVGGTVVVTATTAARANGSRVGFLTASSTTPRIDDFKVLEA